MGATRARKRSRLRQRGSRGEKIVITPRFCDRKAPRLFRDGASRAFGSCCGKTRNKISPLPVIRVNGGSIPGIVDVEGRKCTHLVDEFLQTGVQLVERTVEPIAQAAWLGFVVIHGAVLCLYAALRLVGSGELPSVSFLPLSRPRLEGPEDFSQWRRLRAHFSSGGIRASLPQLVSAPVDASNAGPLLGLWMRISGAAAELRGFSLGLLQGVVLGVAVFARTAVRASAETAVCVVLYVTWYLHAHPASDQSIAVQIGFGAIVYQALVYSRWQFIERLSEPFLVAVFGAKLTQLRVILGQGLAAMIRRIAAALVVVTGFLTGDSSANATPMLPPAQQVEDEQGLKPSSPSNTEDC